MKKSTLSSIALAFGLAFPCYVGTADFFCFYGPTIPTECTPPYLNQDDSWVPPGLTCGQLFPSRPPAGWVSPIWVCSGEINWGCTGVDANEFSSCEYNMDTYQCAMYTVNDTGTLCNVAALNSPDLWNYIQTDSSSGLCIVTGYVLCE
jgi:hypothetical protein